MFSLLLALSISASESLEVEKIVVGNQTAIIPTKHIQLFIHAMELIRDGEAIIEPFLNTSMDNLRKYLQPWLKPHTESNGKGVVEFVGGWLQGIGGYFAGRGSITFAKEQANKRLDFGGGVACIFNVICIGGGFVGIHSADGQESIYLRVTETEDGLVYLPSYDSSEYENLQEQIAEGQVTLD